MDVSIPIESFSQQTNPTVKLSDVIDIMEDPSLKLKLSKKILNRSKCEIHLILIEALMKMNKRDPDKYIDTKRLVDDFAPT